MTPVRSAFCCGAPAARPAPVGAQPQERESMDIAAILLDIAAVTIVVYCAHAAAKKGFLRTVIQMVAYVAIILAASFFSPRGRPRSSMTGW